MIRRMREVIATIWRHLNIRPAVLFIAVFLVILTAAVSAGSLHLAAIYQGQTAAADATHAGSKGLKLAGSSVTASKGSAVSVPACAPQTPQSPAALDLNAHGTGLSAVVDAPRLYTIHGYTGNDLRKQVEACAPHGSGSGSAEFTAETNYQLNWQYDYSISGPVCVITTVKVGLHVDQDLPSWQVPSGANAQLQSQWKSFSAALQAHENGHVAIDTQYAQALLDDLRGFPPTDCADFSASVKHLTDTDVAVLNQANDNYDSSTNHGATQGAVLPN